MNALLNDLKHYTIGDILDLIDDEELNASYLKSSCPYNFLTEVTELGSFTFDYQGKTIEVCIPDESLWFEYLENCEMIGNLSYYGLIETNSDYELEFLKQVTPKLVIN